MKKKLFLFLILLLEVAFFVLHAIYQKGYLPEIFSFVNPAMDVINNNVINPLVDLLHLGEIPYNYVITIVLINVCFIVVYYLIFGTISAIRNKSRRKKVYRVVNVRYQLTNIEEEKFSTRRYLKRFPKVRVISLLIPLAVFALFVLARFDQAFASALSAKMIGNLNIYTNHIQPVIGSILGNDDIIKLVFTNSSKVGYFDLVNLIPENIYWVEYIIIGLLGFVIQGIWYGLLTLIYLPFRKVCAKRKSRRARERYIFKKDYQEYKYRIKHGNRASSKSEEFMNIVESENEETQALAKELVNQKPVKNESKPMDYYDDLGFGVRDLGVGANIKEKKDKAIIEREVRYISDKDFDIELEEEPVIEIVEEDSIDQIRHQTKDDELFYEKYQPNDLLIKPVEEYSKDRLIINDYVSKIGEVNEEEISNDDLVEKIEEPVEEVVEVQEEVAQEVIEEQENIQEEEIEEVIAAQEEEIEEVIAAQEEEIEEIIEEQESIQEEVVQEAVEAQEETIQEVVEAQEEIQEIIEEQESIQEEVVEETPEVVEISLENLSPLEKYRLQKKQERERLEKERQALIESGNLTEENDPLKKYRKPGARIGKSEVRVPTLKEQEILRQADIIQKKQKR